jgi:hypothetical protein
MAKFVHFILQKSPLFYQPLLITPPGDYDNFMTTAGFDARPQCVISIAIDVASHPQNLAAKA